MGGLAGKGKIETTAVQQRLEDVLNMPESCATMKARGHENRTGNTIARLHRRSSSIQAFRRRSKVSSFCAALHACAARTRVQKEVSGESEATRTKTQGQAFGLGPRFPRHGLVDRFRPVHLAGEFRISEPLSDDFAHCD